MPNLVPIPEETPTQLESAAMVTADQEASPSYALSMVNDTIAHCERYRATNHDRRWKVNDSLYFGFFPARYWEGTQIPRSSLGLQITFDQIHAVKPFISSALFGSQGDYFQAEPIPGQSSLDDARAQKANLTYALEHPIDDFGGNSINEFKLAIHQTLLYGNGGVMLQYNPAKKTVDVEWVDIRDIYLDPGASTPSVESARCLIFRKLMTINDLLDLADGDGMNIPSKDILYSMANARPTTFGDMTLRTGEALRAMSYNPATDAHLPVPADRFVEVLMYYSHSRIIWVLDRKWVAFNEKNDLGFIPFAFAPCYIVPGRFYAQGIPDVQEGNQRVCEALVNGRLDEIALSLNPPRLRKRGSILTPSQLRQRPGLLIETEDPQNDFVRQEPQQITTNIFQEVAFFRDAAASRTGITGGATSGSPMRSNASRTKAGIQMQTQGPLSRISEIVDNIENYLILPALYKMQAIMEKYAAVDETGQPQTLPGVGQETVSSDVYKRKCRFKILAASKMLTREQMSTMFPFLMQYLFSGPFMAELHKAGKTVNFDDIFRAFQDATGTAQAYNFIRAMSPEEQQSLNAPPPQVQAMIQKEQLAGQNRQQAIQAKGQIDLTKAAMDHKAKSDAAAEGTALQVLNLMAKAQSGTLDPPADTE